MLRAFGGGLRIARRDLFLAGQARRQDQQHHTDEQEGQLRQPGNDGDRADRAAGELQRALVPGELVQQVGTEIALGRGPGHDETGRQ